MIKVRKSLGIDISDSTISVALLRQTNRKVELLKAASGPVPPGAVKNGNVADPITLGKAIKKLLRKNGIHQYRATVSLVAKPVLMQIVDLPEELPTNIGAFIQNEIRHSATLSGKEPSCDFCGLASNAALSKQKILVCATDNKRIDALTKAMMYASIEPVGIDVPVMACIRALYEKNVLNRFGCNVLLAVIRKDGMDICVFIKDSLEFIRTVDITTETDDPQDFLERCSDQVNAVMQFYDIELNSTADENCEIVIAGDTAAAANFNDIKDMLENRFGNTVKICTDAAIYESTSLAKNESINTASISAVGLALKQLQVPECNVKIDLLPPRAGELKAARKHILVTSILAASVILFIMIIGGYINAKAAKIQHRVTDNGKKTSMLTIQKLFIQQRQLDEQIEYLQAKKNLADEALKDLHPIDQWPEILDQIRQKTPDNLCFTSLQCNDAQNLVIKGKTLSHRTPHLFVNQLAEADVIAEATPLGTNKDIRIEGVFDYSVNCLLADTGGQEK